MPDRTTPPSGKSILKFRSADDCPDVASHTDVPKTYLGWHEWAAEKAKTHKQRRCPTCGFWAIWEPKA